MDIKEYFKKINDESQEIFLSTITNYLDNVGNAHYLATCIYDFSEHLTDKNEKELLATASSQIESAILSSTLGLYRQAFASLRLAFEMALGVAYFSIDKLEHAEWLKGKGDIKWSSLIDKDNGVLSLRFCNAFFEELTGYIEDYNERAAAVYRSLSEFVHGNSETWTKSGIRLKYNNDLIEQFFKQLFEISEIILFTLSCRYLNAIPTTERETMEFLSAQLSHIDPIRVLFGGPKV
ncbi:hypothetical protein [Mariniphaga sp.]|uniref:hypothetical protein n=1 Tax=Mariniphaga sp. TaxID=1954475 RepID=UPI0035663366